MVRSRRYVFSKILIFVMLLMPFLVEGQQIKPQGYFLLDSFKLGQQLPYTLSIKYPGNLDVIFPDSTYDFAPFEFVNKDYFETRTDSTYAIDSVVYYLTTFEIDTIQSLQLPIFVVSEGDSTPIYANPDSLIFDQVVASIPDSVALKESSFYRKISTQFNYPYLGIGIFLLLVIVAGVVIFFGKNIQRRYLLYKLKKNHGKFLDRFYQLIDDTTQNIQQKSEIVLLEWKNYLEKLENAPYTKWTTKEIIARHPNDSLKTSLKSIDRTIYGGYSQKKIQDNYRVLLDYSIDTYHQKIDSIRYGK